MAKRRKLTEAEFKTRWKAAPEADRRFISTMGSIVKAVGGKTLYYRVPPAALKSVLDDADRDTLFCLIAECLCRLLKSSVLERVRRVHRQRKRRAATTGKRRTSKLAAPNPRPALPVGRAGALRTTKTGKSGRAGGRRPTK